MTCTKAIIMASGFGTRRLPLTKAIDKSMVPIGNRPLVDYIIDDLLKAGVTDIILTAGDQADQIKAYYSPNEKLEAHLKEKGKDAELAEICALNDKVRLRFVRQPEGLYGTAIPVWACHEFVQPDEQVIIVNGDQFFYHADGGSEAKRLLERAAAAGMENAMLAQEIAREDIPRYGIVAYTEADGLWLYKDIVEKPRIEDAPSNLNNSGFYLVKGSMLTYTDPATLHSAPTGEYYIVDALNAFVADGNPMAVFAAEGEYLDCGSLDGWLHANNRIIRGKD